MNEVPYLKPPLSLRKKQTVTLTQMPLKNPVSMITKPGIGLTITVDGHKLRRSLGCSDGVRRKSETGSR